MGACRRPGRAAAAHAGQLKSGNRRGGACSQWEFTTPRGGMAFRTWHSCNRGLRKAAGAQRQQRKSSSRTPRATPPLPSACQLAPRVQSNRPKCTAAGRLGGGGGLQGGGGGLLGGGGLHGGAGRRGGGRWSAQSWQLTVHEAEGGGRAGPRQRQPPRNEHSLQQPSLSSSPAVAAGPQVPTSFFFRAA